MVSGCGLFSLVVLDGGLDSILSEHRAVKFDGWKLQMAGNILVLDLNGIFDVHSFEELGSI